MSNNENPAILVLITNDGMGKGDQALQHKLVKTYLRLLDESDTLPAAICFFTDGVKLVVEGSPVIDELKALEAKGVHLVLCNTCLNHYGLADQVQVGVVGGMTDIIEAQWRADKVITI
jgi:selenium metabolism protein YedF